MTRYEHAGAASVTTLTGTVTDAATAFTVADASGWPTGSVGPFWVTVDAGGDEERVLCSTRSGNTLNVQTRGADGTTAKTHSANVTVSHTFSATEADEANAHVNQTTGTVHGLVLANLLDTSDLDPAVVLTTTNVKTVTGKTLGTPVLQSPTLTGTMDATSGTITGATLTNPVGVARGTLGYAQATTSQGAIAGSSVDLTSLTVTVTVGSGRRIRITGFTQLATSVAGDVGSLAVQEGGTQLTGALVTMPNLFQQAVYATVVLTPTAGSHTYKLTAQRQGGTGALQSTAAATAPAFILVEDIGA